MFWKILYISNIWWIVLCRRNVLLTLPLFHVRKVVVQVCYHDKGHNFKMQTMALLAVINVKNSKEPVFRSQQVVMMYIVIPEETELKEILSSSYRVIYSHCTIPESKTQKSSQPQELFSCEKIFNSAHNADFFEYRDATISHTLVFPWLFCHHLTHKTLLWGTWGDIHSSEFALQGVIFWVSE